MYLGFDDQFYQVYEGSISKYGRALFPVPLIVPLHLLSKNEDTSSLASHIRLEDAKRIFREDSFDPITRIRRGRLYERAKEGQPSEWSVPPRTAVLEANMNLTDDQGYHKNRLYTFSYLRLSTLGFNLAHPPKVIMGCGEAHSQWRIIGVERGAFGEDLITLRAITNMGVLPEADIAAVPEAGRDKVKQCSEAVIDTAYRAGPESVIDRCRDFASSMLAAFLSERNPKALQFDLSKLAKQMEQDEVGEQKQIVINLARTLARLHSRAKPNAEASHGAPPIYEEDAELAIQCVGSIMRDLGFAVR